MGKRLFILLLALACCAVGVSLMRAPEHSSFAVASVWLMRAWPLLLVGGEAEGERLHRLARGFPSGRIEVFSCQPLPEVACRLAACASFVGHDSGISHLAAAAGLPGIALWGDTPAAVWRPRSERFKIVPALGAGTVLGVREVMSSIPTMVC